MAIPPTSSKGGAASVHYSTRPDLLGFSLSSVERTTIVALLTDPGDFYKQRFWSAAQTGPQSADW